MRSSQWCITIDGLTDFQVADATKNTDSTFAASVLRDQWYAIFGPPDVLYTDAGTEFCGTVATLNEVMGVLHEIVPEGAKWRLGRAERHGAILKLMMMKMVKSLNLQGLDDMRMAASAACAAKNRLTNNGGVCPLQAVTGRQSMIPSSLMEQLSSGKVRFVVNQEISREEALQRMERVRIGACEAYLWMDSHGTIRRALAAKSRPPKLEMLKEGAVVYIYDPPAQRRGLARRMQDNISWSGPGIVVCVERDRNVPRQVWVRIRGRVKAVPLEKVRPATADELVSGSFVKEALEALQKDLKSGKAIVDVDKTKEQEDAEQQLALEDKEDSSSTTSSASEQNALPDQDNAEEPDQGGEMETDRMRMEKRLLQDVPLSFQPPGEPHELPFEKKQRLFEGLAESVAPPTPLQEAQVRGQLEDALRTLKEVRKTLPKTPQARRKTPGEASARRKATGAVMQSVLANDDDAGAQSVQVTDDDAGEQSMQVNDDDAGEQSMQRDDMKNDMAWEQAAQALNEALARQLFGRSPQFMPKKMR